MMTTNFKTEYDYCMKAWKRFCDPVTGKKTRYFNLLEQIGHKRKNGLGARVEEKINFDFFNIKEEAEARAYLEGLSPKKLEKLAEKVEDISFLEMTLHNAICELQYKANHPGWSLPKGISDDEIFVQEGTTRPKEIAPNYLDDDMDDWESDRFEGRNDLDDDLDD